MAETLSPSTKPLPAGAKPAAGQPWAFSSTTAPQLLNQIGVPQQKAEPAKPDTKESASIAATMTTQVLRSMMLVNPAIGAAMSPPSDQRSAGIASLRDTFAPVAGWIADANPFNWGYGKPGDQRSGPEVEAAAERLMKSAVKPLGEQNFDIRMAMGWKPDGPIKYNGVMTTLDKPIDNMLAVFVRDKKGNVEILDPSAKVQGLTDLYRLPGAMTPSLPWKDEKYEDKRWREIAGTYVAVQIAPLIVSGGSLALAKGGAAVGTKLPQVTKAAESIEQASKAIRSSTLYRTTIAPTSAITGVSGVGTMVDQLSQGFYFTPTAIKNIVDGVSRSLNADKLTADNVRNNLNESLNEFTYKEGANAKQQYIPSLRQNEEPWTRLQATTQGIFKGQTKANNPWEQWSSEKNVVSEDVREAILKSNGINYALYSSMEKYLTGQPLNDRDIMIMRVGINLGRSLEGISIVSKDPKNPTSYTPEEHAETLKRMNGIIQERLVIKLGDDEQYATRLKIDTNKVDPINPNFTRAQLSQFVSDSVKETRSAYNAEQALSQTPAPTFHNAMGTHMTFGQ